MTWPTACYLLVYFAGYTGMVVFVVWRKKRKTGRFPIPEDVLLLRRPGESLERRLMRLDQKINEGLLVWSFVPLLLAGLPLGLAGWTKAWAPGILVAAAALLIAGLVYVFQRQIRLIADYRNAKLGLYGERVIADCLEELKLEGFRVFHDVPCLGGGGPFNLDHVVVGHGAVTVVETKTRRKHAPAGGGPNHKVAFDGEAVIWPRGRDRQPVEQAMRNAGWLEKRLINELDITTKVNAVLAFPGWFVETGPKKPVLITNGKLVANAIHYDCEGTLTPEQEDLVARHLSQLCRDVDFDSIL